MNTPTDSSRNGVARNVVKTRIPSLLGMGSLKNPHTIEQVMG
ncbi:hypothetical protein [Moorena producens]